ncbi:hypothetical protein [Amycolatopsis sp. NPDC004079]|uniref:hypothetical protein n=1 Tax=Amycolatopsis sp. NPDC004079 TaxID=3154549 RepID=UPI0033BA7297
MDSELSCDRSLIHPGTCRGRVHTYDYRGETGGQGKAYYLCEGHAQKMQRELPDCWYLVRREDVEIPELPPRQAHGESDAANRLLSRAKNALRGDGLYPGHHARAGVEWDDREGKFKAVIELFPHPDDA